MLAACSSVSSAVTKHADKIVIEKSKRTLTLMSGSEILKTYRVALGGEPKTTTKLPKGCIWLIGRIRIVSFIVRCILPTQAHWTK